MSKLCTKCGIAKSATEFYIQKKRDGSVRVHAQCKTCIKAANGAHYHANREGILKKRNTPKAKKKKDTYNAKYRETHKEYYAEYQRLYNAENPGKKKYGLSKEEYDTMYEAQEGRCAICCQTPQETRLCIDHCHVSGVVRGLLCRKCNIALGFLQDDVDIIERAAQYLERAYV